MTPAGVITSPTTPASSPPNAEDIVEIELDEENITIDHMHHFWAFRSAPTYPL